MFRLNRGRLAPRGKLAIASDPAGPSPAAAAAVEVISEVQQKGERRTVRWGTWADEHTEQDLSVVVTVSGGVGFQETVKQNFTSSSKKIWSHCWAWG